MNPSVDNGLCSTSYKLLKTTQRLVNKNSLLWWYVFKTSWNASRRICDTSWRRFEDVLKTSWRRMDKTYILVLTKTKTSRRRLEDVLWSRMINKDIFVFIKTSWRRLENVFWRQRRKTSSRCLQDIFIKTNVCWVLTIIFINSFNAVHTFTVLKMEIILMMRTYYNNNL